MASRGTDNGLKLQKKKRVENPQKRLKVVSRKSEFTGFHGFSFSKLLPERAVCFEWANHRLQDHPPSG